MHARVLVLNADYTPHDIIGWKRAMRKLLDQKGSNVITVKYFVEPKIIHDGSGREYSIPSVIVLKKYIGSQNKQATYTKSSIYARDRKKCQYCGILTTHSNRTVDHIIPKSHWNPRRYSFKLSSFENVVTSCVQCNTKKRNRTPQQAGMNLIKKPQSLTRAQAYILKLTLYPPEKEWLEFIK